MNCRALVAFSVVFTLAAAATVSAGPIMPDFSTIPTGWTTDRYEPNSFQNVGTFQGRSNVLGIEITSAGNLTSRPSGYQSTFYNTQGRKYIFNPIQGDGSFLSADLWIPEAWSNEANGTVRTDMWGTMVDAANAVSAYPIIGFTNYQGVARFRVWDANTANGWVDLNTQVEYNAWTTLSILLSGSSFVFSINGSPVYTDNTTAGSVAFKEVIMQAYNFGDSSLGNTNAVDYVAHWSNTQPVPEPTTLVLLGLGLAAAGRKLRRQ